MGGQRGGGGGRNRAARGSDLRFNLRVSLEEAFAACKRPSTFPLL